jgi:biopolymer transport protein ExbD
MARRRKSKQAKKHRDGDIPVGSFSDIAFLLIVYFLVATTLVKVKGVPVDMPSGQESSSTSESKTPTVMLKGDEIYFKDKSITYEELVEKLDALKLDEAEGEAKVIMLESTEETTYQAYYRVLAVISKKGGIIALVEAEEE